ncbi:hypothetical protein, partial [Microcoleus sp. CAWBG556]|uniref:hypothetical protein n=1 Tax=Microcoleus sp. CAWBG556 TaxID=2841650 RepID=UPI0025F112DD
DWSNLLSFFTKNNWFEAETAIGRNQKKTIHYSNPFPSFSNAVNRQLSTVNCQLSTVNCQLSTVNCQLSTE